jgi:site-specific DNA-methyltransferase (adenine-specific)
MLLNGDCLALLPQIPKNHAQLVLTDIPYDNVSRPSNGLRNLDKGKADVLTFDLLSFLTELYRVCYGSFYIFCEIGQVSFIRNYFQEKKLTTRLCIYEKNNPSPLNGQYTWLSSIECCVFAKKKNATFKEHCKSAVWRYPSSRNKYHPTEKPLNLCKYIIETSSDAGEIVLDPCMGGGTTILAAKMTNRKYIGIELDQDYFKIAQDRLALL